MIGEDCSNDSEIDGVDIEFYDDEYDACSDTLSTYSQDDDSTYSSPSNTTIVHDHDETTNQQNTNPPPPSNPHISPPETLESGETTPPVATAPTEQLTNVLHHGLQSRNRRLNQRRRVRSSPPPPYLNQDGVASALFPLGSDRTELIPILCARWLPPVYRDIAKAEYRRVFLVDLKPYELYE
jgi:hypothetical protein